MRKRKLNYKYQKRRPNNGRRFTLYLEITRLELLISKFIKGGGCIETS